MKSPALLQSSFCIKAIILSVNFFDRICYHCSRILFIFSIEIVFDAVSCLPSCLDVAFQIIVISLSGLFICIPAVMFYRIFRFGFSRSCGSRFCCPWLRGSWFCCPWLRGSRFRRSRSCSSWFCCPRSCGSRFYCSILS